MPTVAQVLETVEHTPGSAGHPAHRGQLRGRGVVGVRPPRVRVVERVHPRRGRRVRQPRRLRHQHRRRRDRPTSRCRARGASSIASGSCRSTGSASGTPTRRPRPAVSSRRAATRVSLPSHRLEWRGSSASSRSRPASRTCPTSRRASSSSPARCADRTGDDKTTLVVTPAVDRSGHARRPARRLRRERREHGVAPVATAARLGRVPLLPDHLRGPRDRSAACRPTIRRLWDKGRAGEGARLVPGVDRRPGDDAVRHAPDGVGRSRRRRGRPGSAPAPAGRLMTRVAYLGPEGTFAHQAVGLVAMPYRTRSTPCRGQRWCRCIEAVEDGDCDFGVVPFENSVEGQVNLTVDVLVHDAERIQVCEEVVLAVTFGAYRRPGDDAPLRAVASHPVGLAQCRRWVHDQRRCRRARPPRPPRRAGSSPRASSPASSPSPRRPRRRAGASKPIADGVEDFPGAETRFVVVGRRGGAADRGRPDDVRARPARRPGRGAAAGARAPVGPRPQPLGHRQPAAAGAARRVLLRARRRRPPRPTAPMAAAFAALRADGFSVKVLGAYPQWSGT